MCDTDCVYDVEEVIERVYGNVVGIEERDNETVTVGVGTNEGDRNADGVIDCVPERVFGTEVAIEEYDIVIEAVVDIVELELGLTVGVGRTEILAVYEPDFVFGKELGKDDELDVSCGVVEIKVVPLRVYNTVLDILLYRLDDAEFVGILLAVRYTLTDADGVGSLATYCVFELVDDINGLTLSVGMSDALGGLVNVVRGEGDIETLPDKEAAPVLVIWTDGDPETDRVGSVLVVIDAVC